MFIKVNMVTHLVLLLTRTTMTQTSHSSHFQDNEHEVACDICTSRFRRRIHMIKHVMTQHASQMHRVDLAKFVATGTAPSVSVQSVTTSGAAAHSPWMDNEC